MRIARLILVRRARDRHQRREPRSAITGPFLPLTTTRELRFMDAVTDAAGYVRELWREELQGVSFKCADLPEQSSVDEDGRVPLWTIDRAAHEIVVYRLVYQRFLAPTLEDEWQERFAAEGAVFRATAEYLGKDPWEIAPDRFRHG